MTAQQAIAVMKERLDKARQDFEPYKYLSSGNTTREDLKEALDEAQSDYDAAVRRMEYETAVAKAEAALKKALEDLEAVKDGPKAEDVEILKARISAINTIPEQAEVALEQAQVGVSQAEARVTQAEKAVAQAQAELDVIDVQMKKLTIYAATSGVVLSRNIEPGEVVQAGSPLMTIGQLDPVKITVYVPEDRYGQLSLGDQAQVTVDSFPGEEFDAIIVYIADKAEFTPRNVQTAEGRSSTVFAVELSLENADQKLKPGMPADVVFSR
jgi:multidrug resistance efflux pump